MAVSKGSFPITPPSQEVGDDQHGLWRPLRDEMRGW